MSQTYFWKTNPDHFSKQGTYEIRLDEVFRNRAGSRPENWNLEKMWISFPKIVGLTRKTEISEQYLDEFSRTDKSDTT